MKRIQINKLIITAAVVLGANVAFGAKGLGNPAINANRQMKSAKNHTAVTVTPAKYDAISVYGHSAGLRWNDIKGAYAFNKAGIARYGSAVVVDNQRIDKLNSDLKVAKKQNNKKEILVLQRKLKKAKNDLCRDRAHLKVDKKALQKDYVLTIGDFKQELRSDKKDLCNAKAEVRKDKTDLKSQKLALSKDKEVKADKAAISNERARLNEDMARVNEILK